METDQQNAVFDVAVRVSIDADPDDVYRYVSDLPRSGEWSPECLGGEWIAGAPGGVGAVFRGRNRRAADVVAWAPVVRGEWSTEAEVVVAQPARLFSWAMRDSTGRAQESVWSFRIGSATAPPGETILAHEFVMRSLTEGMRKIVADMDAAETDRFVRDWRAKLERDMHDTVVGIKHRIENPMPRTVT